MSLKWLPFSIKRLPVFAVLMVYVFITSGCIVSLLCLFLQILWLFNKLLYRKIIGNVCFLLLGQMIWIAVDWADIQITLFGDDATYEKFGKEYSLITSSHRGDFDWLIAFIVCNYYNCAETIRTLPKKSVFYVPGFGQILWALECQFLNRNWQKDQPNIKRMVKVYSEYPLPIQVVIFCEGTRFTEEKYKEAVEYANKVGLQPLKYHLMPRTKGYAILAHNLKKDGNFESSYDFGFAYPSGQTYCNGNELTLQDLLAGNTVKVFIYTRKIPISELPSTIEELQAHCHQMYIHKDEAYQYFVDHGTYPTSSRQLVYSTNQIWKLRLNIAIWLIITVVVPGFWLLKQILISSSWLWFCFLIGLVAIVMQLMTHGLLMYARTSHKRT